MCIGNENFKWFAHVVLLLSESRITRIWGLHGLPRYPLPPLCLSHHLRPLPHLRRLCHLRPPPYLLTQSAFIRVIRLIRDSDSYPRPLLPVVHQLGNAGIYRLALARCQRQRIEHGVVNVPTLRRWRQHIPI